MSEAVDFHRNRRLVAKEVEIEGPMLVLLPEPESVGPQLQCVP